MLRGGRRFPMYRYLPSQEAVLYLVLVFLENRKQWNIKHCIVLFFVFLPFLASCSKVVEASPHKVIVLPATGNNIGIKLREQDMSWQDFLSNVNNHLR